jgi:DNA-binding transcriptional MocR family regulator
MYEGIARRIEVKKILANMVLVESHSSGSHDGRNIHLQPINFLWGKPAPSLLPITQLAQASHQLLLNDTAAAVENLEYGDALGCLRLRKQVSCLLNLFYHYQKSRVDSTNICITAGASFALPTILNVLTDSAITKCIWVVSPCFYMACRMFEDVGFAGKIKAVPERGDGSVDVEALDQAMREVEEVRNATSTQV